MSGVLSRNSQPCFTVHRNSKNLSPPPSKSIIVLRLCHLSMKNEVQSPCFALCICEHGSRAKIVRCCFTERCLCLTFSVLFHCLESLPAYTRKWLWLTLVKRLAMLNKKKKKKSWDREHLGAWRKKPEMRVLRRKMWPGSSTYKL